MNQNLIPFGKYKGQPLEILSQDTQYLSWLKEQAWFRERYPQINTLIVNNFTEPTNTPEHNRIQVMFLDDDFLRRFIMYMIDSNSKTSTYYGYSVNEYNHSIFPKPAYMSYNKNYGKQGVLDIVKKHLENIDNPYPQMSLERLLYKPNKVTLSITENDVTLEKYSIEYQFHGLTTPSRLFEEKGVDVTIDVRALFKATEKSISEAPVLFTNYPEYPQRSDSYNFLIEIKPNLSDDYPAVLRQMKASKSNTLVIEYYDGVGATIDQVKAMFLISNIRVILLSEFNSI